MYSVVQIVAEFSFFHLFLGGEYQQCCIVMPTFRVVLHSNNKGKRWSSKSPIS